MKKTATWMVAASILILAITMAVMGIGVYEMDEKTIRVTAYIALPCIILSGVGILYIRWAGAKCPHCGKTCLTDGKYCPHCGKEIK